MQSWKVLAVIVPLFFAIYQSFTKMLPKETSVFLATAYSFLLGSILMFILNFLFSPNKSLALSSKALPIVIGMGIFVIAGNFTLVKAYSLGAPQSIFSLIAYVLLAVFGIIFGVLFWQEKLTFPIFFGTILSIAGIIIIIYSRK